MSRMQHSQRLEAFISDVHFPFHDPRAWELTLKILGSVKPDVVFWGGDIVDCYAVSSFSRDPGRVLMLQDELNAAKYGMGQVRKLLPKAAMYFEEGNHEARILKFKRRVVEIAGLDELRIDNLLGLERLNVHLVPHGKRFKIGELHHIHGDEVQAGYVNVARNVYLKYQGNVIFGHYHRAQVHYNRLADGTCHGSFANPCLCRLDQEYIMGVAQWQQGFSLIKHFDDGYFNVSQVVYFDHGKELSGVYDGRLYSV